MTEQLPTEPTEPQPGDKPAVSEPEPTPTAGGDKPEPGKTFTQEEVNRIAAERAERERKKYADYDTLKARNAELEKAEDERKKASMTEMEKLQAQVEESRKAREAADAERERIQAEAASDRQKYAVMSKAAEMGFEHPEDVYALVDLATIEVGKDGQFTGLEEAITALEGRLPKKSITKQVTKPSPTNPSGASHKETDEERRQRIYGKPGDVYDPAFLQSMGGGAFVAKEE